MMRQPTEDEIRLYDRLKQTKDMEERKQIRERLREIAIKEDEKLKDWPFVH